MLIDTVIYEYEVTPRRCYMVLQFAERKHKFNQSFEVSDQHMRRMDHYNFRVSSWDRSCQVTIRSWNPNNNQWDLAWGDHWIEEIPKRLNKRIIVELKCS